MKFRKKVGIDKIFKMHHILYMFGYKIFKYKKQIINYEK